MKDKCTHHPDHAEEHKRLNRISGQIDGVKKMIDERRYCVDILTQLKAIRSAARAVECNILERHLESCVRSSFQSKDPKDSKEKIEELLKLMKKN